MTNVVSKDAVPSLDYLTSAFRSPSYDARISETRYEYFYPSSGTRNTTSLRFTIPHNNGNFVSNMEGLILALEPKITDRDRQTVPKLDIQSGPCNNCCNSLFASVRISYNTTCVLKLDNYGIYNYTRLLLNNDTNDFKTWAETRCFYPENEDEDLDTYGTSGMVKRRAMFGAPLKIKPKLENGNNNPDFATKNGKFAYSTEPTFFLFKLDTPLINNPLLPGVTVTVELDLNKPSWVFQSADDTLENTNINFDLERARLYVPQTRLNDKLYVQLEQRLQKEALRQFFTTTMINTHSISAGNKTATIDSIGTGYYPSRMYLALQETDRYNVKF